MGKNKINNKTLMAGLGLGRHDIPVFFMFLSEVTNNNSISY